MSVACAQLALYPVSRGSWVMPNPANFVFGSPVPEIAQGHRRECLDSQ